MPDLALVNASLNNTSLSAGDTIEANWEVNNAGDGSISGGTVSILIFDQGADDYLRDDNGQPRVFETNGVRGLSAGETDLNESDSFELPSDLAAGDYELVLAVTPPSGEADADYSNNVERLPFTVEDNSAPDLALVNASLNNTSLSAGDTIEASWEVNNAGDGSISGGTVSILIFDQDADDYLRDDNGQPRVFETNGVRGLSAGETDLNESDSFELPSDLAAGDYELVLAVTPPSGEADSDYSNNVERLPFTVLDLPQTFAVAGFDVDLNDSDQDIDALLGPRAWITGINGEVSYTFVEASDEISFFDDPILDIHGVEGSLNNFETYADIVNFDSAFSEEQREGLQHALSLFSSSIDVQFVDGTGSDSVSHIEFSNSHLTGQEGRGFGLTPNESEAAGYVGISESMPQEWGLGTRATFTYLHEIGHAMGLLHGHDGVYGGAMTAEHNSHEYSIMTYASFIGDTEIRSIEQGNYAQTLMMYDIAALQRIYGADFGTQSENSVYTFDPETGEMMINGMSQGSPYSNVIFRTVWDGNGIDTYNLSNYTTDMRISLIPGDFSDFDTNGDSQRARLHSELDEYASGHVYNALQYGGDSRSLIENAVGGSGDDVIYGNQANNILIGSAGADRLYGHSAADRLYGGSGADRLYGGDDTDQLYGGDNTDRLYGGNGADRLYGGNDTDRLYGGSGADRLFGGSGADRLHGSSGADRLHGNSGADRLYAGNGADQLFGGRENDALFGGGGNDLLLGGNGNDRLEGGAGNDSLRGGAGGDQFVFLDGFGDDTIEDFSTSQTGEKIVLTGVTSITSFSDLSANHLRQVGDDAVITDASGNTITLLDVDVSNLSANDFIF